MEERIADYVYVSKKYVTCPESHIKVGKTGMWAGVQVP